MLSAAKPACEFENGNQQNEGDGEVNRQRVKASHELAKFAALYAVRWSFEDGTQQNQDHEQADAAKNQLGA